MLRYLYCKEIFEEVPDEISLGISISGCIIKCPDCNQKELWKKTGTTLDISELTHLLLVHRGVTCLCLFGGEHDTKELTKLFKHAKELGYRTAWYCGLDKIPNEPALLENLNYIKIGRFIKSKGGLDSPYTNQRFYLINYQANGTYWETDLTYKFQKHED